MEKRMLQWIYRLIFIILLFLALLLFLWVKPYWLPIVKIIEICLTPFILALFLSFLMKPIVRWCHKKGVPNGIAILGIYIFFFALLAFALWKGIPRLVAQLEDLNDYVPQFITTYKELMKQLKIETEGLPLGLQEKFVSILQSIEKSVKNVISTTLSFIGLFLNYIVILSLVPFISFYFVKDTQFLREGFYSFIPIRMRNEVRAFLTDLGKSLGNYIRGQLLVSILIGVLSFLGFWVIGIKYPLLLGIIVGATNIIPYFGPVIGAIPALIIAVTSSFQMAIAVVVIIFILQFVEGNILAPYVVGKSISIHPVLIIFALLVGGEIAGFYGLLISVPVLVIIKVTYDHVHNHFVKTKRGDVL